ncbi:hypothetical protein [Thalassotalea sp. G2M2-11]|uniref:hypothetical protein n=1 Tax=Thalassotalea sp. G2M2-11 TaxID=2787627 RepID=UPI0019CF5D73|nr:hypothetical protein [Thalassotalea sp. G2M2-11]
MRLLLFLLFISSVNSAMAGTNNPSMVISSLPDNPLIVWVKKVVLQAYSDIGYRVTFRDFPPRRGISEAKLGHVDALLARDLHVEKVLPEFIRVPVILGEGALMLFCKHGVECTKAVLDDRRKLIGTISGSAISAEFMKKKNASTYEVTREQQISKMLNSARLDYILSVDIRGYGNFSQIETEGFDKVELQSLTGYHYVHQSKAEIIPQLQQSLINALAEQQSTFPSL